MPGKPSLICIVLITMSAATAMAQEPAAGWDSQKAEVAARDLQQDLDTVQGVSDRPSDPASARTSRQMIEISADLNALADRIADGAGKEATRGDFVELREKVRAFVARGRESNQSAISKSELEAAQRHWDDLAAEYADGKR